MRLAAMVALTTALVLFGALLFERHRHAEVVRQQEQARRILEDEMQRLRIELEKVQQPARRPVGDFPLPRHRLRRPTLGDFPQLEQAPGL
jgi:hypothetical protein